MKRLKMTNLLFNIMLSFCTAYYCVQCSELFKSVVVAVYIAEKFVCTGIWVDDTNFVMVPGECIPNGTHYCDILVVAGRIVINTNLTQNQDLTLGDNTFSVLDIANLEYPDEYRNILKLLFIGAINVDQRFTRVIEHLLAEAFCVGYVPTQLTSFNGELFLLDFPVEFRRLFFVGNNNDKELAFYRPTSGSNLYFEFIIRTNNGFLLDVDIDGKIIIGSRFISSGFTQEEDGSRAWGGGFLIPHGDEIYRLEQRNDTFIHFDGQGRIVYVQT